MPKPMIITVSVEEIAFGKVYRMLDTHPGVISMTYHAEGSKPNGHDKKENGNKGKPKNTFEMRGSEYLLGAMYKHKGPVRTIALRKLFEQAKRSPASVSSLLHAAKQEGLIESREDGYVLTKKGRDREYQRSKKGAK